MFTTESTEDTESKKEPLTTVVRREQLSVKRWDLPACRANATIFILARVGLSP